MPLRDVFALPATTKTLSICMDEAAFHGRGSKTLGRGGPPKEHIMMPTHEPRNGNADPTGAVHCCLRPLRPDTSSSGYNLGPEGQSSALPLVPSTSSPGSGSSTSSSPSNGP